MGRKGKDMDQFILELILEDDLQAKKRLAKKVFRLAYRNGIYPSSIHEFYIKRGKGVFSGFTVPAMNLRCMAYELAKAVFRIAKKTNAGAFIFEIAKSEIGYTEQRPIEYSAVCLAAAIKEGYTGPVFIQGDHYQVNLKRFQENPNKEIDALKSLIQESLDAGFYNIDIDSSTLVDLSKKELKKQQELNFTICAELTKFIRKNQPRTIEVSVGGEIGEVGGKNSTPEELRAFMQGYRRSLRKNYTGLSKISVQTGTSHGGVVLPDGSIAQVNLDFETLRILSQIARTEFGLSGAVQHGASTLPEEAFHKFPEVETAEIHLATQFQNMIYDSNFFPNELRDKMYEWIRVNCSSDKKEGQTDEQFIYKTRKKALGPFKKDITRLPAEIKTTIANQLQGKFEFLFRQLNIQDTRPHIETSIALNRIIRRPRIKQQDITIKDTSGAD